MRLIAEINQINNLNKYNLDGIIFSYLKFSTISNTKFDFEDINKIVKYCHENNKKAILKVDKIIEENEVDELNEFLNSVHPLNIDYYLFTDMAIMNYFLEKNENEKLIYSPKTLNCSYNDVIFYKELGVKVVLSNELPLENIKKISTLDNVVIDCYGHSNIFYSKRKLLSLYKDFKGFSSKVTDELLFIREETRNNKYPIFENENGTFIFTDYKYLFYKEINELPASTIYKIESLFIDDNKLLDIINIYQEAINSFATDEGLSKLVEIDNNIGTSFLYKKLNILKENENE